MSRIRTIKPEFWASEQVISCSVHARLLFIGLWNFCDDNGIHPASYVRLKAEVFPVDSFSIEDIKRWINELIINDLLYEYLINSKHYWIVTGWKNHQKIDKPTYRHPTPDNNSSSDHRDFGDYSTKTQGAVDDLSLSTHNNIAELSVTESNGKESKGKEEDICEVEATSPRNIFVQEIFDYWKQKLNHPKAKPDRKRCSRITKALDLGYSVDELKFAIDGCANTPFNLGENDQRQRYDDIELILRDAMHIDRFIRNASTLSDKPSIMLGVE